MSEQSSAQLSMSLNATSMYDDNSFSFYDKRADAVHQLFLNLSYDINTDYTNLTLYSYNAGVLFRTYSNRTYSSHTVGGLYSIQLDHRDDENEQQEEEENQNDSTDSEKDVSGNEADSSDADALSDSAEVNVKKQDQDAAEGKKNEVEQKIISALKDLRKIQPPPAAGKAIPDQASMDSLSTFIFIQPSGGWRFDKTGYDFYDFRRATADVLLRKHLIGALMARIQYEFEYKEYPFLDQFSHDEQNATLTLSARAASSSEFFTAADFGYKSYPRSFSDTTTISGSGKGKGGVKKKVISQVSTPTTSQLTAAFGIVQKIASEAALTFSYLRRINPSNKARYIDRREFAGALEDDVFDDRYGYQSHELNVQLDANKFSGMHVTVQLNYDWKTYSRIATDVAGDPVPSNAARSDNRFGFQSQLLYPLLRDASGGAAFSIGGQYNFYRNLSNDAYHDYHIHQIALVLEAAW